ncbi:glycerophosphodiester phosphodiesterase family protein [Thioalkalivibrio sp. XN279]|uniref:glycerophosphodiester phosphodiesterase family protein n=1 Tax=Thioalkalivibrio sp. XN279 TaxID=2714953 RepID=UPI00140B970F|nr:glycerophosphodiester phosphodiesterase family protein [Thioalkalivibrio sp. XN279]NHA13864.1 glycerophosphodiester phosphodiesterase [Thioalkalivibrio sp. XN279]
MPTTPPAPVLVAHRGHAAERPENTLPALQDAVDAGARWVEVDVQLCAGGVPVLLHDADLQRVAGRAEAIFDLDAATLDEIPVGEPDRFGAQFPDVRIPRLAEFAAWLSGHPGVHAFVELKIESLERFGRKQVLAASLEALAPAAGRWRLISDDYEVLALAHASGLRELGWVVRGFDAEIAARAQGIEAAWLFCRHQRLPPGPLPVGPWAWVLYEIEDAPTARTLMARGARWLETMRYRALAAALAHEAV